MRFPKLRIAWSLFCRLACVLLTVMWVRSYWQADVIGYCGLSESIGLWSESGDIVFKKSASPYQPKGKGLAVESHPLPLEFWIRPNTGFIWRHDRNSQLLNFAAGMPDWFALLVAGTLLTLPWLPWRFSLRTLLMVTTLVAVVLGMVIYAAGK
jgi:hypothetical protein